ncbi:MAG: 50S ribosomal protein L32 [bacterium]
MPVPKRKVSKARRDKRSAGKKKVTADVIVRCQTCETPVSPHQVCKECGHYKGVKVIRTKTDRMYERNQVRQARQQSTPQQEGAAPVETAQTK